MDRMRSTEFANLAAWNCEFDDIVPGEVVHAARRQELLSRTAVGQYLQKDRHVGRSECYVVDQESALREKEN